MEKPQMEALADIAAALARQMKFCQLADDKNDICFRAETILSLLRSAFETISLQGTPSTSSPLLPILARCKKTVDMVKDILDEITAASRQVSNSFDLSVKEWENRLSRVLDELYDCTNVLSLAMNAGSSLECQSAISQAEVEKRNFDALAQNVLCATSRIFPSIKSPTTGHESLIVEELTMVNDNQSNASGGSTVVCPRARIYATSKKVKRRVRFRCCCNDAPHESQLDYKVFRGKSLLIEEIGLDGPSRWSILLSRSSKPVIVRLSDVPLLDKGYIQCLANDIGIAYLTDQDKSASKPDTEIESRRFESFQTDWGFPSSKVRTVMCESAGIKHSLGIPTKVVLKHYSVFSNFHTIRSRDSLTPRYALPDRHYQIILRKSLTATQEKTILVSTQTRISHEENPLGRLFVTLANVFLVRGDKEGEEKESCNIHFGFDERREAECFARYLEVAQGILFEKFLRGPFSDEKVVYFRDLRTTAIDGTPAQIQLDIVSRDIGDSKHARRAIFTQSSTRRCICFDFKSKASDAERRDLMQSQIWAYHYDENGEPHPSQTDWESLTGQRAVESIEGATFVKGGHKRTANDWLEELDKLFRVMKRDKNDRYENVKIAVIDSGLNDTVKHRYMAKNEVVYKDFTEETRNNSWHGTCCAKIICDIYEEPKLFIARIFENNHANDIDGPVRMAKAIDWAISPSNRVDIISISAGFRDYSKEVDAAVIRAKAAGTLVVAAAANWSNTGTVAFPARHNLTTMCIYSTDLGNKGSDFNPEPRPDTCNFALLGEGFQHPDQRRNEQMSGTSMATAAAVGLAANIIDFSRQQENKSYICRSQDVGKLPGMLSIFGSISRPAGSLRYVAPLDLLPANYGSNRERGRQRVREILSQAMERAN